MTRPPALELGADDVCVTPVAVLSDGDVITGNALGLVRRWRTDQPGVPGELASQDSAVSAVAVLFDDRVVTGGGDGRARLWRTDQPGVPVELVFGNGDWDEEVTAVAEISDGASSLATRAAACGCGVTSTTRQSNSAPTLMRFTGA